MINKTKDEQKQNSNIEDVEEKIKKASLKKRIMCIINLITIEPVIIFYSISCAMRYSAQYNLQLEKACKVSAGFNTSVCNSVIKGTYKEQNFTEENNVVQLYSNSMNTWTSSLSCTLNIIISLFLGAYSDKHKIRIPFMLVSIFGELIANGGTELCAIFMQELSLELFGLFNGVISSCFGGWTMMYAAAFAYTTDISSPQTCTIRIAILYGVLYISDPIGSLLGAVIFKNAGYTVTFSLSSIMFIISFLYGAFAVNEPKNNTPNQENNKKNLIADICNPSYAVESFKLLVKIKGYKRINFLCILVALFIIYTQELGEVGVLFLFAQNAYQWTAVTFNYYTTVASVLQTIGVTLGVYILQTVFKLTELTITLIALFDSLLTRIIFLTFKKPAGLYIGELIGIIRRLACVALRSQSTKCVSDDDNGKVQSILASIETLAIIGGTLIYNEGVYANTESTNPYAIFLLGIGLITLAIIFMMFVYFINKKEGEQEQ